MLSEVSYGFVVTDRRTFSRMFWFCNQRFRVNYVLCTVQFMMFSTWFFDHVIALCEES